MTSHSRRVLCDIAKSHPVNFDVTPSALFSSTSRSDNKPSPCNKHGEQGKPVKRIGTASTQTTDVADCRFTLFESSASQSKSPHKKDIDSNADQAVTITQNQYHAKIFSQLDSEGGCDSVHDLDIWRTAADSETDTQSFSQ